MRSVAAIVVQELGRPLCKGKYDVPSGLAEVIGSVHAQKECLRCKGSLSIQPIYNPVIKTDTRTSNVLFIYMMVLHSSLSKESCAGCPLIQTINDLSNCNDDEYRSEKMTEILNKELKDHPCPLLKEYPSE